MDTTTTARPTTGDTVYAQWRVGPAQQGSGWVDPRFATDLRAWTVERVTPWGYYLGIPGGGQVTISDGWFTTAR